MIYPGYNPDAKPGDIDYRPGPDWPPSLNELRASVDGEPIRLDEDTLQIEAGE